MRKREVTKTFVKRSHKKSEFSRAFTISEIIKILKKIKKEHGDLEVHQQSEMTYEGYDRTRSVDVKEEERPRSMRKIVVLWGYE